MFEFKKWKNVKHKFLFFAKKLLSVLAFFKKTFFEKLKLLFLFIFCYNHAVYLFNNYRSFPVTTVFFKIF